MAEETALYPAWREGLKRFLAAEHEPGTTFGHDWFYEAFAIEMPTPNSPLKEAEKAKLQWLSAFETLREHLLVEHQIALASVRGFGYRVVRPEDQTRWAEQDGLEDVRHAVRKMGVRMTNVNMTALNAGQRRDNADALARLSMLSGMVKKVGSKKLLSIGADED